MGVTVGDVDTLMPHTLCNSQGSKAHVDQQTDVAMSQIVYANAFYPSLLTATVHFSVKIAFADGEHPTVRLHSIELLEVVLQLITEELRHLDHSIALGRLGGGNDILLVEPLVRLVDGEGTLLKIEVRRGQGQQLPLPDAAPVKHLKGVEGQRLIHHGLGKLSVLLPGPEQHLLPFFCPHVARLPGRVDIQAVKSGCVVENGAELIVNRFQVSFRQGLSVTVPHLPDLVLPAHDVLGCDLRQLPLGKIGQDLLFDDALLGEPGVELQLGLNVPLIESNKALKGHVHIGLFLHQELPFPFQRLPLGGKAPFELLLALTLPVCVAELHIPSAVVLVLERCHKLLPLSRRLGSRAVELLVEELTVNPARDSDTAGFRQFLVHLPDELIGVGYGHPQLLGHFVHTHKNLICHDKYLPFFVVGDCCLQVLCFINASLLISATFSRFRNQKSDGPFDTLYYLSLSA